VPRLTGNLADVDDDQVPVGAGDLLPLVGRWVGEGTGFLAGRRPFYYREEATFVPTRRPFLTYRQQTWSAADGAPLHGEVGYLRATDRGVELVVAQATGIAETHVGTWSKDALLLRPAGLLVTPTASPVRVVERSFSLEEGGSVLRVAVRLGLGDQPVVDHLAAVLRRDPVA
jgi:hypothetical protein